MVLAAVGSVITKAVVCECRGLSQYVGVEALTIIGKLMLVDQFNTHHHPTVFGYEFPPTLLSLVVDSAEYTDLVAEMSRGEWQAAAGGMWLFAAGCNR